jgi:hypothetical protein
MSEERTPIEILLFLDDNNITIRREHLTDLLEADKAYREKYKHTVGDVKKFVGFLKDEGIVVEEERKPQNFEFLYSVWNGENPDGLL